MENKFEIRYTIGIIVQRIFLLDEILKGETMGRFLNPDNSSFQDVINSEIYVDKTELLNYTNEWLGTPRNCIAVSHARRFGKSHAAGMIDAYYSLGCDSTDIFAGTRIETYSDYKKYMNKYNVIHVDVSTFWDSYKDNLN